MEGRATSRRIHLRGVEASSHHHHVKSIQGSPGSCYSRRVRDLHRHCGGVDLRGGSPALDWDPKHKVNSPGYFSGFIEYISVGWRLDPFHIISNGFLQMLLGVPAYGCRYYLQPFRSRMTPVIRVRMIS